MSFFLKWQESMVYWSDFYNYTFKFITINHCFTFLGCSNYIQYLQGCGRNYSISKSFLMFLHF